MLDSVLTFFFGSKRDRDVKQLLPVVEKINQKEAWAQGLGAEDFPQQTQKFKERLAKGETLDDILPEAFALAREAANRVLGERAYDVQLMGSIVLNSGRIVDTRIQKFSFLTNLHAALT